MISVSSGSAVSLNKQIILQQLLFTAGSRPALDRKKEPAGPQSFSCKTLAIHLSKTCLCILHLQICLYSVNLFSWIFLGFYKEKGFCWADVWFSTVQTSLMRRSWMLKEKKGRNQEVPLWKAFSITGMIPYTKKSFDWKLQQLLMNIAGNIFTPPPTHHWNDTWTMLSDVLQYKDSSERTKTSRQHLLFYKITHQGLMLTVN